MIKLLLRQSILLLHTSFVVLVVKGETLADGFLVFKLRLFGQVLSLLLLRPRKSLIIELHVLSLLAGHIEGRRIGLRQEQILQRLGQRVFLHGDRIRLARLLRQLLGLVQGLSIRVVERTEPVVVDLLTELVDNVIDIAPLRLLLFGLLLDFGALNRLLDHELCLFAGHHFGLPRLFLCKLFLGLFLFLFTLLDRAFGLGLLSLLQLLLLLKRFLHGILKSFGLGLLRHFLLLLLGQSLCFLLGEGFGSLLTLELDLLFSLLFLLFLSLDLELGGLLFLLLLTDFLFFGILLGLLLGLLGVLLSLFLAITVTHVSDSLGHVHRVDLFLLFLFSLELGLLFGLLLGKDGILTALDLLLSLPVFLFELAQLLGLLLDDLSPDRLLFLLPLLLRQVGHFLLLNGNELRFLLLDQCLELGLLLIDDLLLLGGLRVGDGFCLRLLLGFLLGQDSGLLLLSLLLLCGLSRFPGLLLTLCDHFLLGQFLLLLGCLELCESDFFFLQS